MERSLFDGYMPIACLKIVANLDVDVIYNLLD